MSLSEALPILGPLLADPSFRWWLLGTFVAIGPVPQEYVEKIERAGVVSEARTTRWHWGGLLRIALIGVVGHSKLAERVGSLETAVQGMTGTMRELIVEFRTHRGATVATPEVAPVSRAGTTTTAHKPVTAVPANGAAIVRCDDVDARRTPLPSRPQL